MAIVPAKPLSTEDLDYVMSHTTGLWEELRGQRIFFTGGTGFFGCWLLESFARANDKLGLGASAVVLTRDSHSFATKMPHLASRRDITFATGDVRNFSFPDGQFSHVIHAGTTSGALADPSEMFDTIVEGTRRVLDFAATHGVRKLLFISSGAVYGRQPADLLQVSEDFVGAPNPLDQASAYGEGKRAAELLCILRGKKSKFDTKIARCFAFVGPHLPLDAHFAIGNFIRDGLSGGPIRVGGDGTPFRSYLYAADLAIWLWTILLRGQSGWAYNVGSDEGRTIRQIADTVASAFQNLPPVIVEQMPAPEAKAQRYIPSINRAQAEFGLQVGIPLTAAIQKTIYWHR